MDRGGAYSNEGAAQDQCEDNADEQHAVLQQHRYVERRDDDDEDEQVVHGEAVLGEVTGEELTGMLASGDDREANPERDGQAHGPRRPERGFTRADLMRIAKTEDEV